MLQHEGIIPKGSDPKPQSPMQRAIRWLLDWLGQYDSITGERKPDRAPAAPLDLLPRHSPSTLLQDEHGPSALLSRRSLHHAAALIVIAGLAYGLMPRDRQIPTTRLISDARELAGKGQHTAAAPLLKEVLKRDAHHAEAVGMLADSLLHSGAFVEAESVYQRLQSLPDMSVRGKLGAAEVLVQLGRMEEALKVLGSNEDDPGLGAAGSLVRGKALHGLNRIEEARAQFSVAKAELPAANAHLARLLMSEERSDEAASLLNESLRTHADCADLWLAQGDYLHKVKGDRALALDAYRTAIRLDRENVPAILSAAQLLLARDELAAAKQLLAQARAAAPLHFQVAFVAALVAYKEGRFSEGIMALSAVRDSAPSHMGSAVLAGTIHLALGDLETARAAYVYYLKRFPGDLGARKMLAATLLRLEQPEAAAAVLWPFLDLPLADAELLSIAGTAFTKLRDAERAAALFERAVALKPADAVLLTRLGAALESAGQRQGALTALARAIALAPKDADPRRQLAKIHLAQGRPDLALETTREVVALYPGMAEAHWLEGLAQRALGHQSHAIEAYLRAIAADPRFFPAVAAIAHTEMARSGPAAARERFHRFLRDNPGHLDAKLALAELDVGAGKLVPAIESLERLAADHPRSVPTHLLLATVQLKAGRITDALSTAARGRKLAPRDPAMTELFGRAKIAARDPQGAAATFTALVQQDPRYADGYAQLAAAHRAAGEPRQAINTLERALALHPDHPVLMTLLGRLYVDTQRFEQAQRLARHATAASPRSAIGPLIEGDLHLSQRRPQEALEAYRRADGIRADAVHRIRIHQAESALLERDAPADSLLQALKAFPNHLPLRLYTADALVRLGQPRAAVPLYEHALKLDPANATVLNNLADALLKQGDPRAIEVAQQAYQAAPEDAAATATLGSALVAGGQMGEGLSLLHKAVVLDESHIDARMELARALRKARDFEGARRHADIAVKRSKRPQDLATAQALAKELSQATRS